MRARIARSGIACASRWAGPARRWPCRWRRRPGAGRRARPHVGSNRLPKVLTALRAHLERSGVEYAFETEMTGLRVEGGRVRAVRLAGGGELPADVVVLAVGHSARPVYEAALAAGVALE